MITIMAEDDTAHQRVIDIMNACAAAKLKDVSFAGTAE
jgi:biopolymer transport protein ExbD